MFKPKEYAVRWALEDHEPLTTQVHAYAATQLPFFGCLSPFKQFGCLCGCLDVGSDSVLCLWLSVSVSVCLPASSSCLRLTLVVSLYLFNYLCQSLRPSGTGGSAAAFASANL